MTTKHSNSEESTEDLNFECDDVLVSRFVESEDQEAFSEIYRRHSKMVLGVCNRVLHRYEDVSDAFQATFLVLIKSAKNIRTKSSIACWLYGVAYRISLDAKSKMSRRKQVPEMEEVVSESDAFNDLALKNDMQVLEDELQQLPPMFREPLLLYYMADKSCRQISDELGITTSAVESRIKRGRARLKRSLVRRRVVLIVIAGAMGFGESAANAAVLHANSAQAMLTLAGQSSGSFLSTQIQDLVSKEISNMSSSITSFKVGSGVATFTLATCLFVLAFLGAANRNGGSSSDNAYVQIESPSHPIQDVSFETAVKTPDDQEAGKLVNLLFALDGGSVIYEFIDGAGKKRTLKIDNSFAARNAGKQGTMYLDGLELDPKSMEADEILKWKKVWDQPAKIDRPAGTLLNVFNGVSFTGFSFVSSKKTKRTIEIDRKTGAIKNYGGAKILKDSDDWKQIKEWMKNWKPGRLFSAEKTKSGDKYYFLSREMRKESVLVVDDKIHNAYGKPLEPDSNLAKDVREWIRKWKSDREE